MSKPILLDLFCGAGGCTRGYQQAGFRVVGVDIEPQRHYVGDAFVQRDALSVLRDLLAGCGMVDADGNTWYLSDFAAIHASPPCQDFSALRHMTKRKRGDLITPVRKLLEETGLPWVIENVPGAPMRRDIVLCGSMFGLRTECGAELRRHRWFETNWFEGLVPQCQHGLGTQTLPFFSRHGTPGLSHERRQAKESRVATLTGHSFQTNVKPRTISVAGDTARDPAAERRKYRTISVTGATPQQNVKRNEIRECFSVAQARIAMGIDWMPMSALSQAIPPAYTRWIGEHLLREAVGL